MLGDKEEKLEIKLVYLCKSLKGKGLAEFMAINFTIYITLDHYK